MAWRRPGDKPLSGPMMINLLTHLCVTRPQWVNSPINGILHHIHISQLASVSICGCCQLLVIFRIYIVRYFHLLSCVCTQWSSEAVDIDPAPTNKAISVPVNGILWSTVVPHYIDLLHKDPIHSHWLGGVSLWAEKWACTFKTLTHCGP